MPEGEGRTRGKCEGRCEERSGMGGRKEVVQVNFISSHLSPSLPTLSPQYQGGKIEGADVMAWERRREDTSEGVKEHSSRQFLTCLLPQHTHTSPCPVGVQVSGAALKEPPALLSGTLTAVGNGDTQSHNHTRTHVHTSAQDLRRYTD